MKSPEKLRYKTLLHGINKLSAPYSVTGAANIQAEPQNSPAG
jgi:hypothetical protein